MKKIAIIFMFLMALTAVQASASTTTYDLYTNYVSFINAISPTAPLVENFEDTTLLPGFSITENNGTGTIQYGVYENIVRLTTNTYQVFNYAPGMYAFGGWFDLANPNGPGTGIDVYVNDTNDFVMSLVNTLEGQFRGFVSSTPFTGVRFQGGPTPTGAQETYYGVDVAIAPTPIPAAAWLLGSGLIGLFGIRRKRMNSSLQAV